MALLLGRVETRVWGVESRSHTWAAERRWLYCLVPNVGLSEPPGTSWLQPFPEENASNSALYVVNYRLCAGPHLSPSRDGHIDLYPLKGTCWASQFPAGFYHPAGLVSGFCGHGVRIRRRRHAAVPAVAHVFLAVDPCGVAAFILRFLLEFEGGISLGEEGLVASEASCAHVCTLVWGQTEKEDCLPGVQIDLSAEEKGCGISPCQRHGCIFSERWESFQPPDAPKEGRWVGD